MKARRRSRQRPLHSHIACESACNASSCAPEHSFTATLAVLWRGRSRNAQSAHSRGLSSAHGHSSPVHRLSPRSLKGLGNEQNTNMLPSACEAGRSQARLCANPPLPPPRRQRVHPALQGHGTASPRSRGRRASGTVASRMTRNRSPPRPQGPGRPPFNGGHAHTARSAGGPSRTHARTQPETFPRTAHRVTGMGVLEGGTPTRPSPGSHGVRKIAAE